MEVKWYTKLFHKFMVFLPVVLLLILIMYVYSMYLGTYLIPLIINGTVDPKSPFMKHSNKEMGISRGICFLILSAIFFIFLLISILRTIFMDPGFLKNPSEMEFKLVQKNFPEKRNIENQNSEVEEIVTEDFQRNFNNENLANLNREDFLTHFTSVVQEGPLVFEEFGELVEKIKQCADEINPRRSNENKNTSEALQRNLEDPHENFKGADLSKVSLCSSCLRWKVERSHHCRHCGRCVLKLDHHCPWLANCIGFRNFKYFCLLQLHGTFATLIVALSYWETVLCYNLSYDANIIMCWMVILAYICNLALMTFLIWLLYVNWILVFTGQTIIEQSDRQRFPSSKAINIYDLGWYQNFKTVFGENCLVWFLPFFANYKGEGIIYELAKFNEEV